MKALGPEIPGWSSAADLTTKLEVARILAVVTLDRAGQAAPLARALEDGGICAVEVALRTAGAMEALRAMRDTSPRLLLGAGTVLTTDQADAARGAGADFALAPGLDLATARGCATIGLPFVPGVATASDIQAALGAGCRLLKFFPAEPLGGARGLNTLATPFAHLGVRYLPLGGIDEEKAPLYLALPAVAALGGSWIAPSELIRAGAWDEIRRRARAATTLAARPISS